MSYPVYYVTAGDLLPIMFSTYAGSTGASVTLTGLAVTDIEIYKDGSVTQRASDAGYVLLDTDGIDFDATTGIHGFSIDTNDNTDAGFYTVGAWFHVVVASVTVDAQTVNFIAAAFRIMAAETAAGVPKADVSHWIGTAAATPTVAGVPEVDVTHWIGTAAATPTTAGVPEVDITFINGAAVSATTAQIGANVVQVAASATGATNLSASYNDTAGSVPWSAIVDQGTAQSATATTLVLRAAAAFANSEIVGATIIVTGGTTGVGQARVITAYVGATDTATVDAWTTTPTGTITYKIVGTAPATLDSAGIRSAIGLASANLDTQLTTIDDFLDTEVAAIKAKTDSLTFTVAGQVDANVQRINDVTITGNGGVGTEFGV